MAQPSVYSVSTAREFGAFSFIWRVLVSLLLVAATYNPTPYSYYSWLRSSFAEGGLGSEHFVAGVLLMIGWAIMIVATQRSLGTLGLFLAAALLGGLVWLVVDMQVVRLDSVSAMTWAGLVCLAILLAIGLSWSHIWRRLTGQVEVDQDH